ncbi:MAG: hypothetical protein HGJ94_21085 [Desulfosarcina sp.]|nr:hypothetical protein [Desulfosarcina sp.]
MADVYSGFDDEQEYLWKRDAAVYAVTAPTPEEATEFYKRRYKTFSGKYPPDDFEFIEVGPMTETVINTPHGKFSIRVRTSSGAELMDALNSPRVRANPELARQIFADFGAEVRPYLYGTEADW